MDLSFLWIIFAMADYGVLHSLLASNRVKNSIKKQNPAFYNRYYRLIFNILGFVTLIPVGLLVYLLPDKPLYNIPYPFVMITLMVQGLAGIGVMVVLSATGAGSFLGLNQLMGMNEGSGRLKTDGFYRYMRHPLYTLSLVIIWLLPWMTVNRLAFIASASAYLLIGAIFEERKMLQEFGEEYARYKATTPMFIPDFRKILEK
jgi:protein-S-isoprenylcysteine O-methyltransferase Ste14